MTEEELQTWAQTHVYEDAEQMSRLVFKEILPNCTGKSPVKFGPNHDTGAYDITVGDFTVSVPALYSPV